ncbi:TPA: hypothetical protein TUW61_000941 [Streptococcus equi subsp. zooepidemicus]|uniref:hypothetical protein n=1 Tax=Streptococcus TaxID=1301 RepID=UPI0009757208|nr:MULTISPECIES: hypothetical protein [Streptococcus]MCD3401813.1 hypothetical protein [Streptococcus equi subsp. zooepidemicus]ONH63049.1 hypothetical protein ASN87_01514 [Streptococcus parauberis]PCH13486.1 hypothetical protein A9Y58_00729 [Streptococcus parauberis]UFR16692.1 hypothetical protein KVP03_01110 [Streptococcus equi subsp. zooepidemicus]HEL0571203.1 hypothetical protein [Streptococcus equi subsp. zooepidemicus]
MKKTFFQKSYNLISSLLFFGLISFILNFALNLLVKLFGDFDIPSLDSTIIIIQDKLSLLENYTSQIATILMLVAVSLIIIELTQRMISDSILNYFKSVYQTIRLRQFLRQDEKSESVITIDNQTTVTKFNPILKNFNQSVGKATVDVRKEAVVVFLKYPRTQQAQKLLRDMEAHIKEEIASRNPNYYFSSPNREGNKLWFKATRR